MLDKLVPLPVESGQDGLLHGGLPVVTAVGGHVDGSLVGHHLHALLPTILDVDLAQNEQPVKCQVPTSVPSIYLVYAILVQKGVFQF